MLLLVYLSYDGGLVTKSYPTLCDPTACSLPSSSVHGMLTVLSFYLFCLRVKVIFMLFNIFNSIKQYCKVISLQLIKINEKK